MSANTSRMVHAERTKSLSKLVRKSNINGNTAVYPNAAPPANSTVEQVTKGITVRRSLA